MLIHQKRNGEAIAEHLHITHPIATVPAETVHKRAITERNVRKKNNTEANQGNPKVKRKRKRKDHLPPWLVHTFSSQTRTK